MSVEIRRLYPGDDALVKRIAEDVFDEPVRADRLAAYLASSSGHLMIVALAGGVVDQCPTIIHRHPDKVNGLYSTKSASHPPTSAKASREKCSTRCSRSAASKGCGEACVGTEPDNVPSRGLYEKRREEHGQAEAFVMYAYDL